jgi:glutamate racemase
MPIANRTFASDPRPIGVFDSGVGGLTVLKALREYLPGQDFIYLGDTARVPYGTKSAETVRIYALALAQQLLDRDVKMIVIACNTASAHATEMVTAMAAPVPVIGMVAPAVDAALDTTRRGRVLVMATQSTVLAQSYERTLKMRNAALQVRGVPCQLLVALAEEGWLDGKVTEAALENYIGAIFREPENTKPDTIILGCTHFPLLKDAIRKVAGETVRLVDTGEAAARFIAHRYGPFPEARPGDVQFLVTDAVERFRPLACRFLGCDDDALPVGQIDLTTARPAEKRRLRKSATK